MTKFVFPFFVLTGMALLGCQPPAPQPSPESAPPGATPEWAQEAIWYQIFVERFHNGNPANDPRIGDIKGSWPHMEPEGWSTTRWTGDWYEQEDWARATGQDFYTTVQSRRYGGDLEGVLEKVDYLADLGITAVYFNPLNDSPSLHKYDARTYRHIDRNFGPDPEGDFHIIQSEDPLDPETWQLTAADKIFLEVIERLHEKGIRVIMDFSWNHTGMEFWAWKDVVKNQGESEYLDWYRIESLDDPSTEENEFSYRGWAGVAELPELKKTGVPADYDGGPVEGNLNPGAKAHILNVTRRWLDPNSDGDPSDGIDGFRLDVAEKVPLGFWRDYRAFVRSINPEAYLVGEIWWEEWPQTMMEPDAYVPSAFDAVMNYRWYMPTRSLFAGAEPHMDVTQYIAHIDSVAEGVPLQNLKSFMNIAATHDSPRLGTSLLNTGKYKYQVNWRENREYDIGSPGSTGSAAVRTRKLLLLQQFTWIGAPHIWNGDEFGMWGGDDPDNRKPITWPELAFDPESRYPDGQSHPADSVRADMQLHAFYRDLIAFRLSSAPLFSDGSIEWDQKLAEQGVLSYLRVIHAADGADAPDTADEAENASNMEPTAPSASSSPRAKSSFAQVIFNLTDAPLSIETGGGQIAFRVGQVSSDEDSGENGRVINFPARSGAVLFR